MLYQVTCLAIFCSYPLDDLNWFFILENRQQRVDSLKSCYCYKVVPKAESIVQSTFMHDRFHESIEEAPLVVATPYDVSSFNIDLEESSSL